jgi:hypothetical protein
MTISSSSKMFLDEKLIAFLVLKVLPIHPFYRGKNFHHLVLYFMVVLWRFSA